MWFNSVFGFPLFNGTFRSCSASVSDELTTLTGETLSQKDYRSYDETCCVLVASFCPRGGEVCLLGRGVSEEGGGEGGGAGGAGGAGSTEAQVCQTGDDGEESSSGVGRRRPAGRPVCSQDRGRVQHGPSLHQLHAGRSEPSPRARPLPTATVSTTDPLSGVGVGR